MDSSAESYVQEGGHKITGIDASWPSAAVLSSQQGLNYMAEHHRQDNGDKRSDTHRTCP